MFDTFLFSLPILNPYTDFHDYSSKLITTKIHWGMWSGHINSDWDTRLLQWPPNASCPETNSKQFTQNVLFWMRDLSGAKFTISDFKLHNETLTFKLLYKMYIEMRLRLSVRNIPFLSNAAYPQALNRYPSDGAQSPIIQI